MGPNESFLLGPPMVPGPQPGGREAGSYLWGFVEPQESAIQSITDATGNNFARDKITGDLVALHAPLGMET
jgi:hypothetical protein